MRKLLSLLFLFFESASFAQVNQARPFVINGRVNADSGNVVLHVLTEDRNFYPDGLEMMTSVVRNGRFTFTGSLPYSIGVRLSFNRSYISDMFIVDPGQQDLAIDINRSKETPFMANASMKEYANAYLPAFDEVTRNRQSLDRKIDSLEAEYKDKIPQNLKNEIESGLRKRYREQDSTLLRYVEKHPDSYLALWKFVHLSNFGYETVFDSIFSAFSEKLRNTATGNALAKRLKAGSVLAISKRFPSLAVLDRSGKPLDTGTFAGQQYTLVDFWYSNCAPCIAQFPDLLEVYSEFRGAGFQIVGISTDREKYRGNWLKAIKKYRLDWPQYWDVNGVESRRVSIVAFPTNVLLDADGRIIQRNIKPAELRQFLSEKLSTGQKSAG